MTKGLKISIYALSVMIIIALISPFIASELPIYISHPQGYGFPILNPNGSIEMGSQGEKVKLVYKLTDWKKRSDFKTIFTIIPWSPGRSDVVNANYVSPFDTQWYIMPDGTKAALQGSSKHLLGTSKRGEDVLSGLLHGTRVSLTVGFLSMLLAGVLGIFLGGIAGYYGDGNLKFTRGKVIAIIAGLLLFWYYGMYLFPIYNSGITFISLLAAGFICLTVIVILRILFNRIAFLRIKKSFPADSLITKLIEILVSLPRLILIIVFAAITPPSLVSLILIIGFTSWTEVARITRAEMLKTRKLEYIDAAKALGMKDIRLLFKHALPNIISPVIAILTYGIAGAILAEAGLSFLGIGVPQDVVTWGSMLAAGREHFQAWWLVIFPGIALFATIYLFNYMSEQIRHNYMR